MQSVSAVSLTLLVAIILMLSMVLATAIIEWLIKRVENKYNKYNKKD